MWKTNGSRNGINNGLQMRIAKRISVGEPEGKKPLARPRRIWNDIIKIDLRLMGWYGLD
jgi:hypothetical protein